MFSFISLKYLCMDPYGLNGLIWIWVIHWLHFLFTDPGRPEIRYNVQFIVDNRTMAGVWIKEAKLAHLACVNLKREKSPAKASPRLC